MTMSTRLEPSSAEGVVFGYFSSLPKDVIRGVLSRLDGKQLAQVACSCRDFKLLINANDELWYWACCALENNPKFVRVDLVRELHSFAKFTWKDLYVWRSHALQHGVALGTTAGELAPLLRTQRTIAQTLRSVQQQGQLAVIVRDRVFNCDRLLTCDPVSKGGIMCKVYDADISTFVPSTLTWAPKGELLAVALAIKSSESFSCHNRILLSAPLQILKSIKARRSEGAEAKVAARRANDRVFSHQPDSREDRLYSGLPKMNILALPHGMTCSHVTFSPCGSKMYVLHRDGTETGLYTLDCAMAITSLYGPSNYDFSPVPRLTEFMTKDLSGKKDFVFAHSPNSHQTLVVDNAREIFMINSDNAFESVPQTFRRDADTDDAGKDVSAGVSAEHARWWQKPLIIARSLLHAAMGSTSPGRPSACETAPACFRATISSKRKRSTTISNESRASEHKREVSWWRDLPNIRSLTRVVVRELPKQPLGRSVFVENRVKRIQWVPPALGDHIGRGFWLVPSAILDFDSPLSASLIMIPAPSDDQIANDHVYPFLGDENDEIFKAMKECAVVKIAPRRSPMRDSEVEIPFLFSGAPGGRFIGWTTHEGVFARSVKWSLDRDGDYANAAPTFGLELKVLDFSVLMQSKEMTGKNAWNTEYDELNMRNYSESSGARRFAMLSVANRVLAYSVAAFQWSPSGNRLLLLLATRLAHDSGGYYTVHQWVCWDPAKEVLDPAGRGCLPSREIHGCLSFGARFIPSETYITTCVTKMQECPQGNNFWSPEETAVAFSLSMPNTSSDSDDDVHDFIAIQSFPHVNLEDIKIKSERGELPPVQQREDVDCMPYVLNYLVTPLEFVREGSYVLWSP